MLLKSTCFLCQCISFMCIVICFATLMSFNSRNTVNTPCMDYITISRMIITPIYGWLFCCCVLHLVVWWPYRYAIIHGMISYLFWHGQCKKWNDTYFGMKFIPLLLLSSFRKYRLLTYYVLSALPLFGRIKKQQQFCQTFFSQRRRLANNQPFKVEVTEICNSRLQLKSPVPMKRFLALSTLLAVLLAVHCYPG